ncbi:nuclease-related domain-containing protein [Paenisporosarcina cavernae]|uniref:NERD domain-containing protein n=1 Tax=Paenisporosarcina cavernae TaxID=2320858 RepID=A0A385YQV8_9BACL|nr:nuclease-related domain-containing protein [Paenisporosarcina cavernae]AYC28884.1 NERD domain-containing protein [Paenisporosarcina cavernae]
MLLKKKEPSVELEKMILLRNRLSTTHPTYPKLNRDIQQITAGDFGEEIVAKFIQAYNHPTKAYILHDLLLASNSDFQLDHVLVTNSCIIIVETKHIKGDIHIHDRPAHMTRQIDTGPIERFESPVMQLNRSILFLSDWLIERGVDIPVKGILVFSHADALVTSDSSDHLITKPKYVSMKLREIRIEKASLTSLQTKQLATAIMTSHKIYENKYFQSQYPYKKEDLQTGVQCQKCARFGMEKRRQTWMCECGHRDKNAHLSAMKDYQLLLGKLPNTESIMDFLQVPSRYVARRIMKKYSLSES